MNYSSSYPKGFNEFFYKSKAEKPSWMSVATERVCDSEENLLDDAYENYISRTSSTNSSYSRGRRVFVWRNSGRSNRIRSGRSEPGGKGSVSFGVKMDHSSSSLGSSPKGFNEFFYKSEAEKPSWMSVATERVCDSEENLLDDAFASYISRTFTIDSSYSRSCSQESQDSEYNDQKLEAEVVLRVAMCCGKCENKVKLLTQLEGVTSVVCDRKTEKVTVTGTARPRDILKSCRKLFEQAKMWSPDDTLDDLPQWEGKF